jgi:hypothetical protein
MSTINKLHKIIKNNNKYLLMYVEDIDITHSFKLNTEGLSNYAMELDSTHKDITNTPVGNFLKKKSKSAPNNYHYALVDEHYIRNIDKDKYKIVKHNNDNMIVYNNLDTYNGSGSGSGHVQCEPCDTNWFPEDCCTAHNKTNNNSSQCIIAKDAAPPPYARGADEILKFACPPKWKFNPELVNNDNPSITTNWSCGNSCEGGIVEVPSCNCACVPCTDLSLGDSLEETPEKKHKYIMRYNSRSGCFIYC